MSPDVDVAVVGAGLAGVVAAREIERAGASAVLIEARDRVGGRLLNADVGGGEVCEIGGQWVGPTQDRVLALAAELGLETYPTYDEGKSVLEFQGKQKRYSGTIPRLGPLVLADIAIARRRLWKLATTVPTEAPWLAPDAEKLDGRTFNSWLEGAMMTQPARAMLRVAGRTIWGGEPEEMSLLHVLFYVHSAGGLDPLIDVEGGAQQDRIVGGSALLAERAAAALGGGVVLNSPVRAIRAVDGGVEVAGATTISARRAIVTVPAPLRGEIEYSPELPTTHRRVPEAVPFGRNIKCIAVYDEPFWRREGLSGEALSDVGPATLTFDNTPRGGSPGVLLGFVGGSDARAHSTLDERRRREAVLAGFERLFGPRAAKPERYIEQDWGAERWSGGGPTYVMPKGAWTSVGPALREPAGAVHWAGTETATRWAGFMDGAVRSGERAAAEALAAIEAGVPAAASRPGG